MSRKIASAAAVFAACDRLDASGEPWNRDDVRAEVGGGGFNVIDPLIKAWRALRPIKELAPFTPTVLLQRIAESVEGRFAEFIGEAHKREQEQTRIFTATAQDLSERIERLEKENQGLARQAQELAQQVAKLSELLKNREDTLRQKTQEISSLQTQNDELTGQASRLDNQNVEQQKQHRQEILAMESRYQERYDQLTSEHKATLQSMKDELRLAYELSENRLHRLFDNERRAAKEQQEKSNQELAASRHAEQATRDNVTAMKIDNQRLTEKVEKISKQLEKEQARTQALYNECQALKLEASGESKLAVLQASIAALQKQLKVQEKT